MQSVLNIMTMKGLNKKKYEINTEIFKIIYILIDIVFLKLGNIIYKVVYITTTCQTLLGTYLYFCLGD